MPTSSDYDADYFLRGKESGKSCYENYRWLPHLTVPMAMAMIDHMGIQRGASVLDFGCARGYSVKAFRMLGREARGYDHAHWPIANADPDVRDFVSTNLDGRFDFCVAKDVFEHIPIEKLEPILGRLSAMCPSIFVVVPLGDGNRYLIDDYEMDVTHVVRQPMGWWRALIEEYWPEVHATHRVDGVKDNWYHVHPEGNGFILGSRT